MGLFNCAPQRIMVKVILHGEVLAQGMGREATAPA